MEALALTKPQSQELLPNAIVATRRINMMRSEFGHFTCIMIGSVLLKQQPHLEAFQAPDFIFNLKASVTVKCLEAVTVKCLEALQSVPRYCRNLFIMYSYDLFSNTLSTCKNNLKMVNIYFFIKIRERKTKGAST